MALAHETVQVRVGEGSLWIGGEAYPLRNIARVGQRRLAQDRWVIWKRFLVRFVLALFFGGIVIATAGTVGVLALLALLAVAVWRLVAGLQVPDVYGLVINTAGTDRDTVWSTERVEIEALIKEITTAISRPNAPMKVFNIVNAVSSGEINQNFGDVAGGDVAVSRG